MLEDKPSPMPPAPPADARRFGHVTPHEENPKLINLGVSRYKMSKQPSGDVDLSYLSNFKTVSSRS